MNRLAVVMLVGGLAACVIPQPRGVVISQTKDGGEVALYNEDDIEPSQHLARRDAERKMASACAPRGFVVTGMGQHDTGASTGVLVGSGVSTSQRVVVRKLTYECASR